MLVSGGDWRRGVALLGRAGVGKTTLADALVLAGVCEHRSSMAGELKQDLSDLGIQKGQPHARELMIHYGQYKRAQHADYWIERLRNKLHDDFDGEVIDDVRYPNETAFLRDRGFLVVRLTASVKARVARGISVEFCFSLDESEVASVAERVDLELNTDALTIGECVAAVADAMQPASVNA